MKTVRTLKTLLAVLLTAILILSLAACGGSAGSGSGKTYKVGICNFVDDASLNQIVENVRAALAQVEKDKGVTFNVLYDNCNADSNVLAQIIANFQAEKVDLMIGIATPVAMAMQAATEDSKTPVVFAAVTDPVGAGLVDSLAAPGGNLTGTSDYLDTAAVFNLIFAANPDVKTVGLLYDLGQDASATPIAAAKDILAKKGVKAAEYTGTNVDEVGLAAQALIADGVKVIFTPQDNTVMTAELSIYEDLRDAGVQHYTGADSFALNGAFLGYGVDYANLGYETGKMAADILISKLDPAKTAVRTFDNGTATVNTETCQALGLNYDDVAKLFAPFCTAVQPIQTAESF